MPTGPSPSLPLDRSLLPPGTRLAVALSGGADSVALLLALARGNTLPRDSFGVGLSALHVHHGLRGADADADAVFVQDLCTRLDIPLQLHHVDVPARIAATGETLEEAARELRYGIFRTLLERQVADAVLTAHTLEDQAETVLMKLLRGAWTAGLSAISPSLPLLSPSGAFLGLVIRPLLRTRRAEIEAFLHASGQTWREDATNADPAFTRNRLRHQLLPQLRNFNPSLDDTLANLAELARDDEAFWQAELARLLPHLLLPGKPTRGGGRAVTGTEPALSLDVERLRPLGPAVTRRVLRAAADRLGVTLSFDDTRRLLALCGLAGAPPTASRSSSRLDLAHGLHAERSPRELRLSRSAAKPGSPTNNMAR